MSKYHDDSALASDPVQIEMSMARLRKFQREMGLFRRYQLRKAFHAAYITEHLCFGDTRAAVVVKADPIVVAAYSDELDCVALLRFRNWVRRVYRIELGTRLLTVNTYTWIRDAVAVDLIPGPQASGTYGDFYPMIAEFLAADLTPIEARKARISEREWDRAQQMGTQFIQDYPDRVRIGSPYMSWAFRVFD